MRTNQYLPLVLFLLGFGIFMSTRRSEIVPSIGPAIIIAPVFILRFIRTQPARKGIFLTLLGFFLSMNIALWGLFQIDDASIAAIFNLVRSSLLAILYFLPYMVDRLVYPHFQKRKIVSTLTFPIIATAVFFLFSLEGPFDGDAVFGVFSYGNLAFRQLASIAGLWGFVFVFSWFASIVNHGWERGFEWKRIQNPTLAFSTLVIAIFLFGAVKTSALMGFNDETVRIAAVVLVPENGEAASLDSVYRNRTISPFLETMSRIEHVTEKAALENAKLVSFQEYAITVDEEGENRLIEESKRLAEENDVYFSMTFGLFPTEGKGENRHLLINNKGEVEIDYVKRYPLGFGPFGETAVVKKGAEVIQTAETPYGRIGVSICRDMSFPPYIRQAGQKNVDIMLGPSYDWPKSEGPCYDLRAIENGFSFVRPTSNGYSFAVDHNGKVLAAMDSDETREGIMYADVPTRGVKTIYPVIGDLFAWLCVLGMFGLAAFAAKHRGREHKGALSMSI